MFEFSLLPAELQVTILRYRLVLQRVVLTETKHAVHSRRVLLPVLLVNKAIKSMALEVYYGENIFNILNCNNNSVPIGLRYPNPAIGAWLRKLMVTLDFKPYLFRRHLEMNPWRYLFFYDRNRATKRITSWQTAFPRLTDLEIIIKNAKYGCDGAHVYFRGERIAVKTLRLEVKVDDMKCSGFKYSCDRSDCYTVLQDKIISMVPRHTLPFDDDIETVLRVAEL
jgi:hypothetical protein